MCALYISEIWVSKRRPLPQTVAFTELCSYSFLHAWPTVQGELWCWRRVPVVGMPLVVMPVPLFRHCWIWGTHTTGFSWSLSLQTSSSRTPLPLLVQFIMFLICEWNERMYVLSSHQNCKRMCHLITSKSKGMWLNLEMLLNKDITKQ